MPGVRCSFTLQPLPEERHDAQDGTSTTACSARGAPLARPRHVRRRAARRCARQPRRDLARGRRGGRARRPGRRRLHRPGRAPPPRLRDLRARRRARRDRRPDRADPPRHRVTVLSLRRPDPGLPALRHPRRRVATVAPRSSSAAAPSSSPSGSSASTSATTTGSSRRSSTSSPRSSTSSRCRWEGSIRTPLVGPAVYPTTAAGKLPAWIGVGGTPESVVRAARYGMPLMLAVIGGSPSAFVPLADLYRDALGQLELPELPIGMHSPATSPPPTTRRASSSTRTRPSWSPASAASAAGVPTAGSPSSRRRPAGRAVRRLARDGRAEDRLGDRETLGLSRFQLKYSVGSLPHDQRMESIRLYGEEVVPRVSRAPRRLLGWRTCAPSSSGRCGTSSRATSGTPTRPSAVGRSSPRSWCWSARACSAGRCASSRAATCSTSRRSCWPVSGRPGRSSPGGSTWAGWRAAARSSSAPSSRRSCSACCWSGSSSSARSWCARSRPLATYVSSVLEYADEGSLTLLAIITFFNGIAEELFFRGAMYAAIPKHPVALDDPGLRRRDPRDRQRDARPSPRSCSARSAASSGAPAAASWRRS